MVIRRAYVNWRDNHIPEPGVLPSMGRLRDGKATVAGVVPTVVKKELEVVQLELGLATLSQAVGIVLIRWYAERRRDDPVAGFKPPPPVNKTAAKARNSNGLRLSGDAEDGP